MAKKQESGDVQSYNNVALSISFNFEVTNGLKSQSYD